MKHALNIIEDKLFGRKIAAEQRAELNEDLDEHKTWLESHVMIRLEIILGLVIMICIHIAWEFSIQRRSLSDTP